MLRLLPLLGSASVPGKVCQMKLCLKSFAIADVEELNRFRKLLARNQRCARFVSIASPEFSDVPDCYPSLSVPRIKNMERRKNNFSRGYGHRPTQNFFSSDCARFTIRILVYLALLDVRILPIVQFESIGFRFTSNFQTDVVFARDTTSAPFNNYM